MAIRHFSLHFNKFKAGLFKIEMKLKFLAAPVGLKISIELKSFQLQFVSEQTISKERYAARKFLIAPYF